MGERAAIIGNRFLLNYKVVQARTKKEIEKVILGGCKKFIAGTNGQFEKIALSICCEFQKKYKDIEIEVVEIPAYKPKKKTEEGKTSFEKLDELFFGDRLDFKKRLYERNRKMIRRCDTLICYVDENYGKTSALTAMNYAKRNNKKVINVFDEKSENVFGTTDEEDLDYYYNKRKK